MFLFEIVINLFNFCTSTTGLPTVTPSDDITKRNTTVIIATCRLSVIILVVIIVTSVLVIIFYSRIHKTSGALLLL